MRKRCFNTVTVESDFDHQQAAVGQVLRRLLQDVSHVIESVVAAGQRHLRLAQIFFR